jgi:hypothetical protein
VFITQSCTKQEKEEVKAELAFPNASVTDGFLHFPSIEAYKYAFNFVSQASKERIMEWESSLDFESLRGIYEQARKDDCGCDDPVNFASLKAKYGEKLSYDEESQNFSPRVNAPLLNWFQNQKGAFLVVGSLIYLTNDSTYSFDNQDLAMSKVGKINPQDWKARLKGASPYLSKFEPNSSLGAAQERVGTCSFSASIGPSTGEGTVFSCTSNGCHATRGSRYETFVYRDRITVPGFGETVTLFGGLNFRVEHRRKTWLGWTVCERTNWNIDHRYRLTHNLTSAPASAMVPLPPASFSAIRTYTTGFECEVTNAEALFTYDFSGWPVSTGTAAWNNFSFSATSLSFCANPLHECTTPNTSASCPNGASTFCF